MDSLDLPTHQLILNDLASNLAESLNAGDEVGAGEDFTILYGSGTPSGSHTKSVNFLSTSAALSQISLAHFAASIASASQSTAHTHDRINDLHLSSVLDVVVRDALNLSSADVEANMAWAEWPLPDQLACNLVRSLLQIAAKAPRHRSRCIDAVVSVAHDLATALGATSGDAHIVVTRLVPMLHGLYRAIATSLFHWKLHEFAQLVTALTPLTATGQTVQRLNDALLVLPEQQAALAQASRATRRKPKLATVRPIDPSDDNDGRSSGSVDTFFSGDEVDEPLNEPLDGRFTYTDGQDVMDDPSFAYRFALLTHYRKLGRALSGHFVLCCSLETLGSVLAQALAVFAKPPIRSFADYQKQGLDQSTIDPARAANPDRFDVLHHHDHAHDEAAATQKAWASLHRYAVHLQDPRAGEQVNGSVVGAIIDALPLVGTNKSAAFGQEEDNHSITNGEGAASALHLASRAYHDVQRFIEKEGQTSNGQLFADVYAIEILSESLKLGTLASIALSRIKSNANMDAHIIVRIRALLSESAILIDPLLQGAALQSASILVRNYPSLVGSLTTQLRRFAASPQEMFVSDGIHVAPVLSSAAKCLANCVTIAPGDDLAISTMYALLNHLGKESTGLSVPNAGGAAGSGGSVRSGLTRGAVAGRDFSMTKSGTQALFAQRNEDEKRIIHLSIVTIVSRLALEINRPELISLTVSMLLQRLRNVDAEAEAAILNNLVPLALAGSKSDFVDVIHALSAASRSAMTGGANRRTNQAIQAAQMALSQGLGALAEEEEEQGMSKVAAANGKSSSDSNSDEEEEEDRFAGSGRKQLYLLELLHLFSEKGLALQASASGSRSEQSELSGDLASLLPVIATLLSHNDINPQLNPSLETVSVFRNMWFLSVIFGFTNSSTSRTSIAEALGAISLKTPTLVPETAKNYLETDLQYNSVLKREYSSSVLDSQRKTLSKVIPGHSSEIKSFGFPQTTFLSTIYFLECTRSAMGQPSMILSYFVNEGLNTSSLVGSMEAIADQVIASFISDLSVRANSHAIDPRVSVEIKNLLLGSCHRVEKVRVVSRKFLDRLFASYPSLACDQDVVYTMLEILTLLRHACEGQYRDEFTPTYTFHSERAKISFELSDSYSQREEILTQFLQRTRNFLSMTLARAPVELQSILQRYLSTFDDDFLPNASELGKSIAVDYARSIPSSGVEDVHLPSLGGWRADSSSSFVGELSAKSNYLGEMTGIHLALAKEFVELKKDPETNFSESSVADCRRQLVSVSEAMARNSHHALPFAELRRLLYRSAALLVSLPKPDFDLLHHIVQIPVRTFTPQAIETASHVWTWIIGARPVVETKIMVELCIAWGASVQAGKGLFQTKFTGRHALLQKTEMTAFDREEVVKEKERAARLFGPHLTLLQLISSRFQAFRYRDPAMVLALVRMLQRSAAAIDHMSTHPLARQARFSLIVFGFRVIQSSRLDTLVEYQLRKSLYDMAFQWFATQPSFTYGANRLQSSSEMQVLKELLEIIKVDHVKSVSLITSFVGGLSSVRLAGYTTIQDATRDAADRKVVLQLLLEDELRRISVWVNPLGDGQRGTDFVGEMAKGMSEAKWQSIVAAAWRIYPDIVAQLPVRFKSAALRKEAGRIVRSEPHRIFRNGAALELLTEDHLKLAQRESSALKWLLYWGAVSPVDAIVLFQPSYGSNPMLLQYAMRTLEHHPVDLTFFYVPQVVQALRDDQYGYVEQFIFETSKVSQLFCHQILWNMKANSYKDDEGEEPDPMKPTLDRVVDLIVEALDGEAQDFYDREFGFFNEVTSISGKLKPYIKKSKPEKKAKIDEEMDKIRVDPGVYLPSNPDGVVVDLDRRSGRPLQSHAKAPFMATFKVRREINNDDDDEDSEDTAKNTKLEKTTMDVWQAAIFKVGDDCRQDVLALQCMAMLKNIFQTIGLDAYLYPYRVTATGPGCGVIDVVANATSRDEMGRSKINSLIDFFIGRYGNVDSIGFQKARMCFIQSMAAYSVACHLLQCRDRHNGNIMIQNDTGHLVHIDFGFLFDIGPGGMHFEPYSFKLTEEFIEVMGGINSQGFQLFCELTIKAFLACRPYANQIVEVCHLMRQTGLPSFKDQGTTDRIRGRFMLDLDERGAAKHALSLIKDAAGNRRSIVYDRIQLLQNGIPYK